MEDRRVEARIKLIRDELAKLMTTVNGLEELINGDVGNECFKRRFGDCFEAYMRITESNTNNLCADVITIDTNVDYYSYLENVEYDIKILAIYDWVPCSKEEFEEAKERANLLDLTS